MLVYTMHDLRVLAHSFSRSTGLELTTIGYRAADNWQLFTRLEQGYGCSAKAAERVTRWFLLNWPGDLAWPQGVPDLRWHIEASDAA